MKTRIFFISLALVLLGSGVAMAQRMAVSASLANIRSGPGTQYDIIWKVEKFYPVLILKKSGNWFRFRDFEADEGWIHNSLLQNIDTIITTAEACNIRKGPGTKYDILFTAGKGIPFKVLNRRGSWLEIQHADGDRGWLHKSLVW